MGAVLYLVFAAAHVVVLDPALASIMAPLAAVTALGMGAVAWRCRRRGTPVRIAHALLVALLFAGIANSGAHLAVTRDVLQSTNFVLVFVAAGLILFSRGALLVTALAAIASWLGIAVWLGGGHQWMHMGFAMLTTSVGALVAVTVRRRVLLRLAASEKALVAALADAGRELERRHAIEAELRALSQELEARVQERTQELEQSHSRLLAEMDERRSAERSLEQKNEQLRQAQRLETVGLLAGGVAHDFNNLLTVFMGCAELAKRQLPLDSPVTGLMTEIETTAEQASKLTRQLLAFGRKQVLAPKPTNLNDTLTKLQPLFSRLLGSRVKLSLELDRALALTEIDPVQLEQAFANLVLNARDAMPEGGHLKIRTRNVRLRDREHGELGAGKYVVCEFSDTGMGMDEAVRAHVFEPFFSTKGQLGTGLGLASVHGTIKQSRGEVEVDSVAAEGTTFRIYLPAAASLAPMAEASPQRAAVERNSDSHARILLVEDSGPLRALLEQGLKDAGFEVISAAEGRAALERVSELRTPVDLVVTDVRMPGMGGRELVEKLRSNDAQLRALFMSAYSEDELARGSSRGAALLQKPFSCSALVSKVQEMLAAS